MPIEQNGVKVKLLYKREGNTNTEIKLLQDNSGNIIHRRSNIRYTNEDGIALRTETKTWGVEELNPPTPPTKQFHEFTHWESDTEGIIGPNTLAPKTDAVYRPVYEAFFPGEIYTTQMISSGQIVNYGWGDLAPVHNGEIIVTEGFTMTHTWNPQTNSMSSGSHGGSTTSSVTFGVDVHLEIEFVIGDGPFPQMIYKNDVLAGTKVSITGSQLDQFFSMYVQGPQVNFNTSWHFDGMIYIRAFKL